MKNVAILGFGCAGYHCAMTLRGEGYKGDIHVFSDTELPPYNPMLTTYYAGHRLPWKGLFPFGTLKGIASSLRLTLHTNSAVHGDMGLVKDGDMVIILTKSGETSESIYLARLLRERDIHMWLLTFCGQSTLAREIPDSIILDLSHEGDPWNIMPNNSTTMNLIVLQGLAMMIARKKDLRIEDFKRNHPGGHIGEILNNNEREH